jgi:hypothetical protein
MSRDYYFEESRENSPLLSYICLISCALQKYNYIISFWLLATREFHM